MTRFPLKIGLPWQTSGSATISSHRSSLSTSSATVSFESIVLNFSQVGKHPSQHFRASFMFRSTGVSVELCAGEPDERPLLVPRCFQWNSALLRNTGEDQNSIQGNPRLGS